MKKIIIKPICKILLLPAMLFLYSMTHGTGYAQSVQFNQLNFNYDGNVRYNSQWGAVDLTTNSTGSIFYLNLTIGDSWVIENVPVPPMKDPGNLQTIRYWFPIGPEGIPVITVNYGYTVTSGLGGKPPVTGSAPVIQDTLVLYSGFTSILTKHPSIPNLVRRQQGGAVVEAYQYQDFPNQDAGINQCVPTAVSNSLQFLDTENNLGMAAGDMSIGSLYTGVGCNADGSPNPGWIENKKNYVKAKKLPITTGAIMSGSQCINELGPKVMKDGQDVELVGTWTVGTQSASHCMNVTGWADLGGGDYQLITSDDQQQTADPVNDTGGTIQQSSTYDKNTHTWDGALSVYDGGDFYFVYECPVLNVPQIDSNLPGGETIETKPKAGPGYQSGKYKVENLKLTGFSNTTVPPELGTTVLVSYNCMAGAEFSSDSGYTFSQFSGYAYVVESFTHVLDSAGTQYYETEIQQMNLMLASNDSLMTHIFLQESPVNVSTGLTTIKAGGSGYLISSFFDVFLELSTDFGYTWIPQDYVSACMEIGKILPPETLELNNLVITTGPPQCFDALQTITTSSIPLMGTEGVFIVQNEGDVTLIAGKNIICLPGTKVNSGGRFHGMITTSDDYCGSLKSSFADNEDIEIRENPAPENSAGKSFFRVYPNPTSGAFTLELTGKSETAEIKVDVYELLGTKILEEKVSGQDKYEFSLSARPKGIFILRVITGRETGTVKIVKQ